MFLFAFLIGGFFLFSGVILPWIIFARIQETESRLTALKAQLQKLLTSVEKNDGKAKPKFTLPSNSWPWQSREKAQPAPQPTTIIKAPTPHTSSVSIAKINTIQTRLYEAAPEKPALAHIGFEQQFGALLPVWIGGIAFALAGLFLVKYSIDMGLLNPTVRVVLGMMFGGGLLYSATWVRTRPRFANGERISQALSGAGIADLYVCFFAATNLYHLIPAFVGLSGMAAVTAAAVLLSLRHGMPIAMLGLIGGFLTPAMVETREPQAPVLFLYLYFVFSGLLAVSRKKGWWPLAIAAVCGAFLWVCFWLFGHYFAPGDSLYLGLFLLAISVTTIAASKQQYDAECTNITDLFKPTSVLNYLSLGGSLLLMGGITGQAGFGLMEWGLFGILSVGGIVLAYANQKLYGLLPWISMAVNIVMLLAWNTSNTEALAITIVMFGILHMASGYLLQSRSENPLLWAALTSIASLSYYLLGYFMLNSTSLFVDIPLFWGSLALGFAMFGIYTVKNILVHVPDVHTQKQHLLAIYSATSTAFISLALAIELSREFLSVAFAIQLLALAWLNTRIDVRALRALATILGCLFGCLLLPQLLLVLQMAFYAVIKVTPDLRHGIPIVDSPFFQLGLPAVCFALASYLLRQSKDDMVVRAFEIAAITLAALMLYYLTRHIFHGHANLMSVKAGFIERGVITNTLFVYALACLWMGQRAARPSVLFSGLVIAGIAIIRIIYFDLIVYNPLWSAQNVGSLPVVNALWVTYGLPILWMWQTVKELRYLGKLAWVRYAQAFTLLLAFVLVSLNVRQLFHGSYLNGMTTGKAEIYSYSIAWLLFGLGLLFYGTIRSDKMIRMASLAVMILTTGKVFLYDASELDGLLRVLSFLGLGFSLLGLSWFYTRFVFRDA